MTDPDSVAIQGVWNQVAVAVYDNPDDELNRPGVQVIFSGNRFSVKSAQGKLLLEGAFTLDSSAQPKQVDWKDDIGPDAGRTLSAIYRLDGDGLVFIAADPDAPRPTAFRVGPGLVMRTFVRAHRR